MHKIAIIKYFSYFLLCIFLAKTKLQNDTYYNRRKKWIHKSNLNTNVKIHLPLFALTIVYEVGFSTQSPLSI